MSKDERGKSGRFQKGKSGNPKGRPRMDLGVDIPPSLVSKLTLENGKKMIPIREGSETRMIPMIEAIMLSQTKAALAGNPYAQRQMIERHERAETDRALKIAKDNEWWEAYCTSWRLLETDAKAKGKPAPEYLPHPEDVVIEDGKPVRFIGPTCEEGLAIQNNTIAHRDVLIKQAGYDQKKSKPVSDDPLDKPDSALLMAFSLNQQLPKRHRLDDFILMRRYDRYSCTANRVLEKELYADWRKIGFPRPRGFVSPPRIAAIQTMMMTKKIMAAIKDKSIDLDNQTDMQIATSISEIFNETKREPEAARRWFKEITGG